jgi:O-antigen ligase
MASRVRQAVVPLYLFLCLLLGGSGQGIWANMVLQLLGLALLVWSAVARTAEPQTRAQRLLLVLVLLALALVLIQQVPLPPAMWEGWAARRPISDGFKVLGIAAPSLPISVAPYDSLSSIMTVIPALAMLSASLRIGFRPSLLALALVAGTFAGILLGALQVSSPDPLTSHWYLFEETNFGSATGFFANANHMALLLVITIPFLAAALAHARGSGRNVQRFSGAAALVAGGVVVIAVGIALNKSLAGYGLAVPVLLASVVIAFPGSRAIRWLAPTAAVLMIAAAGLIASTPISSGGALRADAATSVQSREVILKTSLRAAADFTPLGSGLGTFARVYAVYEDPDRLDPTTYVNHAHNDYVELAIETGVPGVVLILLFLGWWAVAAWRAWRQASPDPYARAAAVATAAMLIHSLVDFPLRTAALSACFAVFLALLVRSRTAPAETSQLRPARHVVVG